MATIESGTELKVVRLSDLEHNQEAIVFAALESKETGTDKHGRPFVKCKFRDRRRQVVAPLWSSNALRESAESWPVGCGYRLRVRGEWNVRFGMQMELIDVREAIDDDAIDGYDFADLFESSPYDLEFLWRTLQERIAEHIDEPPLRQLIERILESNRELFLKMPAAQDYHHSYTGGLIEHVCSMVKVSASLADHYGTYYGRLDPPLNKGVIVAAAILHDIGKLRELAYDPVGARYTVEGQLVGHVLIGRDLVRDTAREIPDLDPETQLLLEHAILAHHGSLEFGAPKLPQTIEAMIVHFVDDLDSKVNMMAMARQRSSHGEEEPFTDYVKGLGRRVYRGMPRGHDPSDL